MQVDVIFGMGVRICFDVGAFRYFISTALKIAFASAQYDARETNSAHWLQCQPCAPCVTLALP